MFTLWFGYKNYISGHGSETERKKSREQSPYVRLMRRPNSSGNHPHVVSSLEWLPLMDLPIDCCIVVIAAGPRSSSVSRCTYRVQSLDDPLTVYMLTLTRR